MAEIEKTLGSENQSMLSSHHPKKTIDDILNLDLDVSHRKRPPVPNVDSYSVSSKIVDPKEAYSKVRERMMELEIERDEQRKTLELLREVRAKENKEMQQALAKAKEEGARYAEMVKNEMASRIEKQVSMIEALLEDKKQLQETLENNQD
jgi:hypothetical protein